MFWFDFNIWMEFVSLLQAILSVLADFKLSKDAADFLQHMDGALAATLFCFWLWTLVAPSVLHALISIMCPWKWNTLGASLVRIYYRILQASVPTMLLYFVYRINRMQGSCVDY